MLNLPNSEITRWDYQLQLAKFLLRKEKASLEGSIDIAKNFLIYGIAFDCFHTKRDIERAKEFADYFKKSAANGTDTPSVILKKQELDKIISLAAQKQFSHQYMAKN